MLYGASSSIENTIIQGIIVCSCFPAVCVPVPVKAGDGALLRGLLLGAVVEAHKRTKGAAAMERDRDKARREQVKVQGLLDGAIRDKRRVWKSRRECCPDAAY